MSRSMSNKKQDEKNLKTLRELASVSYNKQCFDCYQRGPTYVNMTIGSFVCTSCSGRLRGLNPPHRVKSMSMATFTQDEIEFIKSRGNEHCRRVWMGRHDKSRALDETSFKDETQMKDFLTLKYEKKRWYVSPAEAGDQPVIDSHARKTVESPGPGPTFNNGHDSSCFVDKQSALPASPRPEQKSGNLVSLLDSDPFASPVRASENSIAASFANFANFDAFDSTNGSSIVNAAPHQDHQGSQMSKSATIPVMSAKPGTSAQLTGGSGVADKYSALKELDELFSQPTPAPAPIVQPASHTPHSAWPAPPLNAASGNPFFGSNAQQAAGWPPLAQQQSSSAQFSSVPASANFGANPFFAAPSANPFGPAGPAYSAQMSANRLPNASCASQPPPVPQYRPPRQDAHLQQPQRGGLSSNPFAEDRNVWNPFMN